MRLYAGSKMNFKMSKKTKNHLILANLQENYQKTRIFSDITHITVCSLYGALHVHGVWKKSLEPFLSNISKTLENSEKQSKRAVFGGFSHIFHCYWVSLLFLIFSFDAPCKNTSKTSGLKFIVSQQKTPPKNVQIRRDFHMFPIP